MTARAAAVLLLTLPAGAAAADPEKVADPGHQFRLELPDGWQAAKTPEGSLRAWRHEAGGSLLVLTRVDSDNRAAWRRKGRFFAEVEEGVERASRGYRRLRKKRRRVNEVPALDLWFRRAPGAEHPRVLTRFLFFRRYTLILTLGVSDEGYRRHRAKARRLLRSFRPYFEEGD